MVRQRGFTLVELMIVLVIVAILAAIAYPSYREYVRSANQANAQQFMLDVAMLAHHFRLDTRDYPTGLAGGAGEINAPVPNDVDEVYSITWNENNGATPPTFLITATPKAGTIQAGMSTLTVNQAGAKTPADEW